MKLVKVYLESVSPLGFSRHYEVPHLEKESPADYEERTWRHRTHIDKEGQVIITPMMIKNCYRDVGKFKAQRIPGKGTSTYAKHFKSGILVEKPIPLGIQLEDINGERLFVPSDGVSGGGKRVTKIFPFVSQWNGVAEVYILDDTITQKVFEEHTHEMGRFTGIGFWRPANGGLWGRFKANDFVWEKL